MKTIYTYRAVRVCEMLFGACAVPMEKDAFVTANKDTLFAQQAIIDGYRWIRTEKIAGLEYAILERQERLCDSCSGSGVINKHAQHDDYDKGTCQHCYGRGSIWA